MSFVQRSARVGTPLLLVGLLGMACATAPVTPSAGDAPPAPPAVPTAPPGFVEMTVKGVLPTGKGHAVFLADAGEEVVLPLWIGPSEALAIQLRLDRKRFERPLTHDLLDTMVRELGGRVVKVHVDGLKDQTFVGTVFLEKGGAVVPIDARPSDALALALGGHVPIFVSEEVVLRAGVRRSDLDSPRDEVPPPTPSPASGSGVEKL